jgi:ketosteroid isomerase-like protein
LLVNRERVLKRQWMARRGTLSKCSPLTASSAAQVIASHFAKERVALPVDRTNIVKRLFDGHMNGDLEGALSVIHPEIVVREAEGLPYGGEWLGLEGFGQLLAKMASHYEFEILSYDLTAAGERVVGEMKARFTSHTTRSSLETTVVELYRFIDDQVADIDVYCKDTKAIADLIGG